MTYACIPYESGQSLITIALSGSDTINITDNESGDIHTYQATVIGNSTRAVSGYFDGGTTSDPYREDFNWILSKNTNNYTQMSHYKYTRGSHLGEGGICIARATRH
jgi:hypothetical protein